MVENAVSYGCGPADGRTCDAEARFFIAADGAGVPGADLEIDRLSRIELFGKRACGFRQLLAVALAAEGRSDTDTEKNLLVFFREIHKADERAAVMEGYEAVFRIGKAAALPFLLGIGRHVVNGVFAVILPA